MGESSPAGAPLGPGFVSLCVPNVGEKEMEYLRECIESGWVSSAGPFVDRFEREIASRVGVRRGVATSSGTTALHTALLVAGVQPEDEVLVSTLTFVAPANVIRYLGAWPVLVDAEPRFWQMDVERLIDFLERDCRWQGGGLRNKTTGRRIRAVLPVHILGHPIDMGPVMEVARKYNLPVIEDATECLGAEYGGEPVGGIGDMACFSFNGNKIITSGAGGMLVTNDERLADRARYLTTQAKDDGVEYVHREVGYNYRMSNLQAAVGCAQLEKLDSFIEAKRRIGRAYAEAFSGIEGLSVMREAGWAKSTFWMLTVTADAERFGMGSRALMQRLLEAGIQSRPLWQPMHRSEAHRGAVTVGGEVAEALYRDGVSLPCSVGLQPVEFDRVVAGVLAAHKATRGKIAGKPPLS